MIGNNYLSKFKCNDWQQLFIKNEFTLQILNAVLGEYLTAENWCIIWNFDADFGAAGVGDATE